MSNTDRDLTPIVDHVARSMHERAITVLDESERALAAWDNVPAAQRTALKQHLLPIVLDVLAALDAQDQRTADLDVLAALEAQFEPTDQPTDQPTEN